MSVTLVCSIDTTLNFIVFFCEQLKVAVYLTVLECTLKPRISNLSSSAIKMFTNLEAADSKNIHLSSLRPRVGRQLSFSLLSYSTV